MPLPSSYETVPFGSTLLPTDPPVKPPAPLLPPRPDSMHSRAEFSKEVFMGETYARVQRLKQSAERLASQKTKEEPGNTPKEKPPVPRPRKFSTKEGTALPALPADISLESQSEKPEVYRAPTFFKRIVEHAPVLPPIPLETPKLHVPLVIPRKSSPEREKFIQGANSVPKTGSVLPERASRTNSSLYPRLDEELLSLKSKYDDPPVLPDLQVTTPPEQAESSSVANYDAVSVVAPLSVNRQSFQTVGDDLHDLIASLDQMITSTNYTVAETDAVSTVVPEAESDDEATMRTFQDLWESPRAQKELESWLDSLKSLLKMDYPDATEAQIDRVLGQFLEAVREEGAIIEGGSKLVFLEGVHIPGSVSFSQSTKSAAELMEKDWADLWQIPERERRGNSYVIQKLLHDLQIEELWFSHNCRKMTSYGKGFLKQEELLMPSFQGFHSLAFEPFRGLRRCWKRLCPAEVAENLVVLETVESHRAWLASLTPRYMHYFRARSGSMKVMALQSEDSHFKQWIKHAPAPNVGYELTLERLLYSDFVTEHLQRICDYLAKLAALVEFSDPQIHREALSIVESLSKLQTRASENEVTMSRLISELQDSPEVDVVDISNSQRFWAGEFEVTLLISKRRELKCRAFVFDNFVLFSANGSAICRPISIPQLSCSLTNSHAKNGQLLYAATIADFSNEYAIVTESRQVRDAFVKVCLEMQAIYMRGLDFGIGYEVIAEREFDYKTATGRVTETYPGDELAEKLTSPERKPDMKVDVNCFESFQYQNTTFQMLGQSFGVQVAKSHSKDWFVVVELQDVTKIVILEEYGVVLFLAGAALYYATLDEVMTVHLMRASGKTELLSMNLRRLLVNVSVFSLDSRVRKGITTVTAGYSFKGYHFLATLQVVVALKPGLNTPVFSHFEKTEETVLPQFRGHSSLKNVDVVFSEGFRSLSQRNQYPLPLDCKDASLKSRIAKEIPISAHPLTEHESLLVYNRIAVFLNSNGVVSREEVIEFPFSCVASTLIRGVLIAFGNRGMQAYWLSNPSKVCLVRSGQFFKLLSSEGVFSAAHPAAPDRQLICRITIPE